MAAKTAKDRAVSTDGQRRDRGADRGASATAGRRVAHLTPDERMARGKAARDEAPRSSHGRWVPAQNRPDPVASLEEQGASRGPELVPIRYGRMLGVAVHVLPWRRLDHGARPGRHRPVRPERAVLR